MTARPLLFLLTAALVVGCCPKGGGKTGAGAAPSGSVAAPDASEKPATPGKFADASLPELERRAKKAGWKVSSSQSSEGTMFLELSDRSHYAYVQVIDVTPRTEKGQKTLVKMGDTRAVAWTLDPDPAKKAGADALLASLSAKAPLETATRESIVAALAGWKMGDTSKEDEDGLVTVRVDADRPDGSAHVEVDLYDFAAAKKEGRVAVDQSRILCTFVCRDCTRKEKRLTAEAWQTHKARVLLGKLSNP